jgi:hypothetical protein
MMVFSAVFLAIFGCRVVQIWPLYNAASALGQGDAGLSARIASAMVKAHSLPGSGAG